jgi:PAS domain S-box-containing protein
LGGAFLLQIAMPIDRKADAALPRPDFEGELLESRARLALAVRAGKIGIWDWNLETNEMLYSEEAKAIFGFEPGSQVTFEQVRAATHPEDLPATSALGRRARDPKLRAKATYEYRIIRPDGAIRWVLADGDTVFREGPDPVAVRYVGTIQDVTERKLLLEALEASQARLTLAMQVGRLAVWDYSGVTNKVRGSPELNVLLGFPPDRIVTSEDYRSRYAPGERERLQEFGRAAIERGDAFMESEVRVMLPGGEIRWLLFRADFVPSASGSAIPDCLGVVVDITAQKHAEEHRQLLTRELQHRVKNTLAMVIAIVNQTFRSARSVEDAQQRLKGRVVALNRAQDLLARTNWRSVSIVEVVESALAAHRMGEGRFRIGGPDFALPAKQALSLSLVLYELATNAAKYGALSGERGSVNLAWDIAGEDGEETFRLTWQEVDGPPVEPPASRGFGTKFIDATLAGDFGGEARIEFAKSGFTLELRTRLENISSAEWDDRPRARDEPDE